MRYVSIDIETTGTNPETDQILSIGAVIEDTNNIKAFKDMPKFHGVIKRDKIQGGLYALNMNKTLLEIMTNYTFTEDEEERDAILAKNEVKFYDENEIVKEFYYFLAENGYDNDELTTFNDYVTFKNGRMLPTADSRNNSITFNVAGKNFSDFDKLFLEKLPHWGTLVKPRRRVIDPAVTFIDWHKDETVPSLSKCKERAGYDKDVSHNAVHDAWDVIQLLRKEYD